MNREQKNKVKQDRKISGIVQDIESGRERAIFELIFRLGGKSEIEQQESELKYEPKP